MTVWTQHGACPMWVSLINRVPTEFYSSRYITIPLSPLSFSPYPLSSRGSSDSSTSSASSSIAAGPLMHLGVVENAGFVPSPLSLSFSIAVKSISARVLCTYPRRIYSILLANAPPYRLYLGDRPY